MPTEEFSPYDLGPLSGEAGLVNSHAAKPPVTRASRKKRKSPSKQRQTKLWREKQEAFRADYMAYISSPEWKAKRMAVLKRDRYACKKCFASYKDMAILQVHHLTYENFKNEPLEDLITLCKECHEREHGTV